MHKFRVWAPLATKVQVLAAGRRHRMNQDDSGWWSSRVGAACGGSDYGFIIDGAGPFPDPRSPWQPNGVHGLSRLPERDRFRWTDAKWTAPPLKDAVIYELHIGTFTPEGNFDAAVARLPHLANLGITHVELMPVNEFPGERNWGYDGVDLYAPHHAYGPPAALKRLVDACHRHKLAVLLDVVYNHLGPSGNYLAKFGPYFTTRYASPWGAGLNFDGPHNHEVRRFFCDNALMWLRDYHFDGLRLDAVHGIVDTSAFPFLEQLEREVVTLERDVGRRLVVVAESDLNDPRLIRPVEQGGFGLDAQWSDDFHHALQTVLVPEGRGYYGDFGKLGDVCHALKHGYVYDGRYSGFRRRPHGRPTDGLSGDRFLAYLQNHDQVGNRERGDRSSAQMSMGRLKVGAALVMTSPFVPMIFQGEEWGATTPFLYFTDYPERKLARSVRRGRCREFADFGWRYRNVPDPQNPGTFTRSKLDWDELKRQPQREILEWYHQLLRLRRDESELRNGRMDSLQASCDEAARVLMIERGRITVTVNLSTRPRQISLRPGPQSLLLSSDPAVALAGCRIRLPPDSVAILKRPRPGH